MFVFTVLSLATAVVAAQTKGCGKENHITSGSTITVDGDRTAALYIPPAYDYNKPSPLIVSFHGFTGSSNTSEEETQYSNPRVNNEYVTVFPQGVGPNGTSWEGMNPPSGANDIKFINDLLDTVSGDLCLDDDRFYASGFSNGGGFVNALACDARISDRFAAFGMNSAAVWQGSEDLDATGCNSQRARTPVFEVHGAADPFIKYQGGTLWGKSYLGLQAWLHGWAEHNSCRGKELQGMRHGLYRYFYKPACATHQFKILGLGHAWWQPKGAQIGSSKTFMNFFAIHTRST